MRSCYSSKLIIYVWLWTDFRRSAEAFTPIQSKNALFLDHSLCDSHGIPGHFRVTCQVHDLSKIKNGGKLGSCPSSQLLLLKGPIVFYIRGLETNHTTVSKLQALYWQDQLVVALSRDCVSCLPAKTHCP